MGILQSNSGTYTGTTSFDVTLPSATAAGSRVVVIVAGNTVLATPSGFTLRASQVNYMGHYLWDRAGGASSWTFTASGQLTWWVAELNEGAFDAVVSHNNANADTSILTESVVPSAGDRLLIVSAGSTHVSAVRTVTGWTNSFVTTADLCQASADYPMQAVALREVTANGSGSYSTTATFSASSTGRTAIVASYVSPEGGGGLTYPANLTATPVSASQIDLGWDVVATATDYDVERDGVVVLNQHATTSASDTGLTGATGYDYRVRAGITTTFGP